MSRFYFGDSDESDEELNDSQDNLPFPKPLSRASFLARDFDPATFLSSLSNRHQSLADLQSELRELSQLLSKELLDLVNENYQDFLSLGTALNGGDEKVKEVRAALLGFQRDVRGLKDKFENRSQDIRESLNEKKQLRSQIAVGYDLLDVAGRIELLEKQLMIPGASRDVATNGDGQAINGELTDSEIESDESDAEEDDEIEKSSGEGPVVSLRRLEKHINQYVTLQAVIGRVGQEHPFILEQESKISAIRGALSLDLSTALKQADGMERKREDRLLAVLRLYELLGEQTQAVTTLLNLKV